MDIKTAAERLVQGQLVAFPTETVYGLGADAENAQALDRLYRVKGRPKNHPVIVHIGRKEELEYWATKIPPYAFQLAEEFWPGPMTLLLPRTSHALDAVTGGQEIVGIRFPSHPVAISLLNEFHKRGGHGVAAPSANRFGHVSPTSAHDVAEELGEFLDEEDVILDGGECEVGIESTIIDCTGESPRIIRLGAITYEMIKNVTPITAKELNSKIRVSGNLPRHYSPNAKVQINQTPKPGEGFLALADLETPSGVIRLAAPRNVEEFAHQLYAALRKADVMGLQFVSVILPEGSGLAEAIKDRVTRAASEG